MSAREAAQRLRATSSLFKDERARGFGDAVWTASPGERGACAITSVDSPPPHRRRSTGIKSAAALDSVSTVETAGQTSSPWASVAAQSAILGGNRPVQDASAYGAEYFGRKNGGFVTPGHGPSAYVAPPTAQAPVGDYYTRLSAYQDEASRDVAGNNGNSSQSANIEVGGYGQATSGPLFCLDDQGWQRHEFSLRQQVLSKRREGSVSQDYYLLSSSVVEVCTDERYGRPFCFSLQVPNNASDKPTHTLILSADNASTRDSWVRQLAAEGVEQGVITSMNVIADMLSLGTMFDPYVAGVRDVVNMARETPRSKAIGGNGASSPEPETVCDVLTMNIVPKRGKGLFDDEKPAPAWFALREGDHLGSTPNNQAARGQFPASAAVCRFCLAEGSVEDMKACGPQHKTTCVRWAAESEQAVKGGFLLPPGAVASTAQAASAAAARAAAAEATRGKALTHSVFDLDEQDVEEVRVSY